MSTTDHDIAIVGGGLAGMSLALALKDSGFRVALVDDMDEDARLNAPAGDRALALAKGSAQLLKRIGVWDRVLPYATPIHTIHVSDRGHPGKVRLHARQEGVDALGWVITARDLERQVLAALGETATHRLVPARVIGLKAGMDGICVSVDSAGGSQSFTARLLVGADGGQSSVRRLLGIGQEERDYGQVAVTCVVRSAKGAGGTAFERFTPEGPLALLPVADGQSAVVWTRHPDEAERLLTLDDAAFTAELQTAFGWWLGEIETVAPRRSFPLRLIRATRLDADRAILIGNAAHQLHPVAGQGYNLGLRDAARLAEALLDAARRGVDLGDRDLLARFATERLAEHRKVIGMTNFLATWFATDEWSIAMLRNAGLALVERVPLLKRAIARQAMGLLGEASAAGR